MGDIDEIDGCRKPRWFAAACKRYTEVPAFFNPATIEKQKGKAKGSLLLSTLNSPAKDHFSILVMKLIVSNCLAIANGKESIMKANMFRNMGAAVVLLGGMGGASVAQAVNGALAGPASSTDVWGVVCGVGTAKLKADVRDLTGGDQRQFNVQIVRPHNIGPLQLLSATNATAPDGGSSAFITLVGPQDVYFVMIDKTGATAPGAGDYTTTIECRDAGGAVTTVGIPLLIQNQ